MLKTVLFVIAFSLSGASAFAAQLMAANVAASKAKAGQIKLIDIRRPDEWKRSGVGRPAHTISMHQKGFLKRLASLTAGDKSAPVALMCATGIRSTWLAGELEKHGYTNVINVREGMKGSKYGPGWLKRGLPLK